MKPKLLFVIDTLEIGGAERSLCEILGTMRTCDPVLCRLYPGDGLADAYHDAGVRTIALHIKGKYNFYNAVAALRSVIRSEQPDLVVTTLFRSDVVGRIAGLLERIPVVSSFVNDTYSPIRVGAMGFRRRAKHRALQALDAATARFATHFISNSYAIANSNARTLGISRGNITVIYRARDASRFAGARASRLPAKGPIVILNVARLEDRKGQLDIIAAMPQIRKACPRALLKIAGEGAFRTILEQRIEELDLSDCIDLLGSRDDIPQLLADAHVFVSASEYEGLPGAVIEAMLAGVPMTLSNMDVHREMQVENAAVPLFPLNDADGIAQAVVALLSDYASSSRHAGTRRIWAHETFNLAKVVAQHEELYRGLITKTASRNSRRV
ncbi:MAG: glycosyltransferase family 4 protein [Parerythrobacter sp.]